MPDYLPPSSSAETLAPLSPSQLFTLFLKLAENRNFKSGIERLSLIYHFTPEELKLQKKYVRSMALSFDVKINK